MNACPQGYKRNGPYRCRYKLVFALETGTALLCNSSSWLAEILAAMASDLLSQILDTVSQADGPILSNNAFPTVDFTTIKSALDRLGSREMIIYEQIDREEASLTLEAQEIAAQGSHEAKVFEAVRQAVDGLKIADLPVRPANCTPARLDHQQCEGRPADPTR